jgi:hypothetical protein
VTAKEGYPGAFAASGADGAARTSHRVAAALGAGDAAMRNMISSAPEVSAASANRRVAVRSSARGSPQGSISTAPSGAQRAPSSAARSTARPSWA